MQLHEFMTAHRREILENCRQILSPTLGSVDDFVCHFFDELLHALRRDSGVPRLEVGKVTSVFAAISQAVARTGAVHELRLTAEEYDLINNCLDAGIAASIEGYWHRNRDQALERHTERYGFVAHELRDALRNANTSFRLMRAGKLDIEGRAGAVLAQNLARMNALIAQWLTSVHLDTERAPQLQPVHVASFLRDVEASTLPDRDISLVLELDEMLFVAGDDMLLHSAVSNLVHNAIRFTRPASKVWLSARALDDRATIEVTDECGGLGGRELSDLCQQREKRLQGTPRGFGLGLAITRLAAESLGGELTLTDIPGDGCVFSLCLPLLQLGGKEALRVDDGGRSSFIAVARHAWRQQRT